MAEGGAASAAGSDPSPSPPPSSSPSPSSSPAAAAAAPPSPSPSPCVMSATAAAVPGLSSAVGTKTPKKCGVCGDRAKSFHFGGISCDSCKAFFRRSVQNDAHKSFQCPYEGRCDIAVHSRKCCQSCRFRKCLAIGMERGWVMSEDERLQLLRRRMMRKKAAVDADPHQHPPPPLHQQQQQQQQQQQDPTWAGERSFLGDDDATVIHDTVQLYDRCIRDVPSPPPPSTSVEVVAAFGASVRRHAHFAGQLRTFRALAAADRAALLRSGTLELCVIGGVMHERPRHWPPPRREACPGEAGGCGAAAEALSRLVSASTAAVHARFVTAVRRLQPDQPTLLLLLLATLFSPDRPGLSDAAAVEQEQGAWLRRLRGYAAWRYGERRAASLHARLLLTLPDLRELNDAHARHALRLDRHELRLLRGRLGDLLLDHGDDDDRESPEQRPATTSVPPTIAVTSTVTATATTSLQDELRAPPAAGLCSSSDQLLPGLPHP